MDALTRLATELLKETEFPRDKLPYTTEFDRLYQKCAVKGVQCTKFELMQRIFNVAKRGGFGGRTSTLIPPEMSLAQIVYIGRWLGDRLPARNSLPYSQEFESRYTDYKKIFGVEITQSEFWLSIDTIAKKARGEEWRSQLNKAQESALLAVEIYNKPLVKFKTANFVVLMVIAWTALMHAIFAKLGVQFFYKDEDGKKFKEIDGDRKAWELTTCVNKFFGGTDAAIVKNLEFFIGLRNKIEHRCLPELDDFVFGECQALLFNFEDILRQVFGCSSSLVNSLSLALQFSHLRDDAQIRSMRSLRESLQSDIVDYVDRFRSTLTHEVLTNQHFSYRVFLIPKTANHESSADLAVEFVKVDPSAPEDKPRRDAVAALIKSQVIQVANAGRLKAKQVCTLVEADLRKSQGDAVKFTPSSHHVRAWKFYKIRPPKGAADPRKTNAQYCHYDDAHTDYVYTEKWVTHLITEFRKVGQYDRVMAYRD
ncbi:MAG TPA: DUF3644 domain-containing protein [Tepidisphaeraceae bacterium]|nr:DUF3644 domain-containing protein [Tepidisphaeraceae bacterium]